MKLLLSRDHGSAAELGARARRSALDTARHALGLTRAAGRDLAGLILREPDSRTVFRGHLVRSKCVAWSRPIPLSQVKAVGRELGDTVNDVGASPQLVEDLILDYFAKRVSLVMTNVPGPERTLYLAGREIAGVMFWVPQSGRVGLGISIFSYAGSLRIGVASDAHLVPDPELLVEKFHDELDSLGLESDVVEVVAEP